MPNKLLEIESLIDAMGHCDDVQRYDELLRIVSKLVCFFEDQKDGRLLWLKTRLPNFGEEYSIAGNALEKKLEALITRSANEGCKEAQYELGNLLHERGDKAGAMAQYEKSARQGYAPAQWTFGLGCIHGIGADKDIQNGMFFVELAADQGYEYALEYLIELYAGNDIECEKANERLKKLMFVRGLTEARQ